MMTKDKIWEGLLFRLIMGILVPVFLAFLCMGCILFLNVDIGNFHFASVKGIWLDSVNELGAASLKDSANHVNKLGEKLIQQQAEDVARQLEIYIKSFRRAMPAERLFAHSDATLTEILTQKVGETGYIVVCDNNNIIRYHPDPEFMNSDATKLYDKLGPSFVKIVNAAIAGAGAGGYYEWTDTSGKTRGKYLWITPVKGTNFSIAATAWTEEFSKPSRAIEARISDLTRTYSAQHNKKFALLIYVLIAIFLILFAVIYVYCFWVIRPIRRLSEAADTISMGDLNASIDVKARGEVLILAQSIERMRASIKIAIDRLKKKR
ncbi:MAG TPA: HAMP domain-containing protein [Syntrophorhabdaceae bacterium]|nr:HAMP domain-containing protein [Syntrophorhabdaceae bacterium]